MNPIHSTTSPNNAAQIDGSDEERLVTVISPYKHWAALNWRELYDYRDLLYFMVTRNLKVRYKQTFLGMSWAVIQPFFTMVVFSIFFGELAGISSEGTPYPVFAYCALVPWTFFANSVALAGNSLIEHENAITKVYFPKVYAPLAAVITSLVDMLIAFVVLLLMLAVYGINPSANFWTLPFFILLAMFAALAVGLWLSGLNIQYRDVRHAVPFLIQFWLFATPIVYSSQLVPEKWRAVYGLNPMASVVDGFRWALLDQVQPSLALVGVSTLTVFTVLVSGLIYFRRMERNLADII